VFITDVSIRVRPLMVVASSIISVAQVECVCQEMIKQERDRIAICNLCDEPAVVNSNSECSACCENFYM
jgi:hypothetical protein